MFGGVGRDLSDLNDREKQIFPRDIKTISGSGISIKMLSASTAFCDKPVSVLGRAVMALPFYLFY